VIHPDPFVRPPRTLAGFATGTRAERAFTSFVDAVDDLCDFVIIPAPLIRRQPASLLHCFNLWFKVFCSRRDRWRCQPLILLHTPWRSGFARMVRSALTSWSETCSGSLTEFQTSRRPNRRPWTFDASLARFSPQDAGGSSRGFADNFTKSLLGGGLLLLFKSAVIATSQLLALPILGQSKY
jgi:hypothetical protein